MKRIAILSMDVEEWYHLDYISEVHSNVSMIDGLDTFLDLANQHKVPTTLFVLSDLVVNLKDKLLAASQSFHEIALHGTSHKRPLEMTLNEFEADCIQGINVLTENLKVRPRGYRASCFSFDRDRLEILREKLNIDYDSSRINFGDHPLYGSVDMTGFVQRENCLYSDKKFTEFEMPTVPFLGKNLPISGGGYLRIFPWWFLSILIKRYIRKNNLFSVYIHPFEMSSVSPPIVIELDIKTNFRFKYNIKSVPGKMEKLITLLKKEGFEFMTYNQAHEYYNLNGGE